MIVNLNTICKVRLTDAGRAIWMSQIDLLPEAYRSDANVINALKNAIDDEGCLETELWNIMNIFGPFMSPEKMPFSTATIELNKNPIFNIHS